MKIADKIIFKAKYLKNNFFFTFYNENFQQDHFQNQIFKKK